MSLSPDARKWILRGLFGLSIAAVLTAVIFAAVFIKAVVDVLTAEDAVPAWYQAGH